MSSICSWYIYFFPDFKIAMPKLTLRDLFALVTITAIIVAWWLDHRRLMNENRELRGQSFILDERNFNVWKPQPGSGQPRASEW
jgi:hypothetical protein